MATRAEAAAAPASLDEVVASVHDTVIATWGDFVAHLPFIGISLAIIALTWLGAWLSTVFAARLTGKRTRPSLRRLIDRLLSLGIWALGLTLAAVVVFPGLSPAKALGGLGLLSVAVGFAFKDTFENFFAGMLMLWKYPFESGDFIESGEIMGRVERVNVRVTHIRQVTGELLIVPNASLFKNSVLVLTNQRVRRIHVATGVAYDEDLAAALEVIETAVRACESRVKDYPVQVFATGFGSSSMDIDVSWWCDSTPLGARKSRNEVVVAIKAALDQAGIEIPYPYRTLHFRGPIPVENEPSTPG
ncbi:mechanosensitive ion channel family protein [Salinisphaera sp.]|uniref:mechanosensitive ion channel family protein n=1 Tax=Salinisphaera sp. TaxID=1914330 RepID=UPI000C4F333D|nr:mechanosensitive ion channel family protein [Salinisphaera sp.]MBS62427.1 mechanosensitive ion channel protein MscS [Salinisphaera sp.]